MKCNAGIVFITVKPPRYYPESPTPVASATTMTTQQNQVQPKSPTATPMITQKNQVRPKSSLASIATPVNTQQNHMQLKSPTATSSTPSSSSTKQKKMPSSVLTKKNTKENDLNPKKTVMRDVKEVPFNRIQDDKGSFEIIQMPKQHDETKKSKAISVDPNKQDIITLLRETEKERRQQRNRLEKQLSNNGKLCVKF